VNTRFAHGRKSPRAHADRDLVRAGRDRWLVSYADLVTLLLACFVTAYSAAYAKPAPVAPVAPDAPVAPVARVPTLRDLIAHVVAPGSQIDLIEDSRGLVVSLPESATFPTGSAALTDAAKAFLTRLAEALRPTAALMRIEGHTDDVPLTGGRYGTNWELSTARASAVVLFLVSEAAFAPERLSAAGYGEFHPRAPNETPEQRALNRRVDVVVSDGRREDPR
jgi:chemotaxis protein MotB